MNNIKLSDAVSIVMPVYNGEAFIVESIRSVMQQSFQNWELIVVDDASTDGTVSCVKSLKPMDERIRIIQLNRNSGAALARNKGIESARGRYIAFLDGDDIWLPNKLERQLKFMRENSIYFSFTAYQKVNLNGAYFGHVGVPVKVDYYSLLKTCSIGCLTAIYDTKYFGKVYMPEILKRQDFGLWLKLLKMTKYAYGLNEILAKYRVHSGSISANKMSAALYTWRLYRDVEKLNLLASIYYFMHYSVRGLLRTKAPALARKLGVLN